MQRSTLPGDQEPRAVLSTASRGVTAGLYGFQNALADHQCWAYLVNVLKPLTGDVGIDAQTRDESQKEMRVEYELTPAGPRLLSVLFGASVFAVLVVYRTRDRRALT